MDIKEASANEQAEARMQDFEVYANEVMTAQRMEIVRLYKENKGLRKANEGLLRIVTTLMNVMQKLKAPDKMKAALNAFGEL